jgi:subtilisin family serine protease
MNAAAASAATVLQLVQLDRLMALSTGSGDVAIGLVDGPVAVDHPDLAGARVRPVGVAGGACLRSGSAACIHGTFVAGILVARRESPAPAICPGCTLLVRPIFRETDADSALPTAAPLDVGEAIVECMNAGARVVNLSAATGGPTTRADESLRGALDHAAARGVVIVAAAGNQAALGSSEITRHPGVIPVVAYDLDGQPMDRSNLGRSMGRRGLGAPGDGIISLAAEGSPAPRAGSSFAAAIVTGAVSLLWSLFPSAEAAQVRYALTARAGRTSVVPPMMNAQDAYDALSENTHEPSPLSHRRPMLTFTPRRA